MKIILFTQSSWSIPSIVNLMNSHQLVGVIVPMDGPKANPELIHFLRERSLVMIPWQKENAQEISEWITSQKVDLGICFGFSFKIPKEIFSSIPNGVVNIHFGKLPDLAGPDPLFWAMKNGDSLMSLSFHQINEQWDAGTLLFEQSIPIFPGEPYGLLASRLSYASSEFLVSFLATRESIKGRELLFNPNPLTKPSEEELSIHWQKQSANEIEALVNAANPVYGGARTTFRGNPVRILEVSPADVNLPGNFQPGEVVYSDPNYGIYVKCQDGNFLRINILAVDHTIISGQKFAAFGVKPKELFS